jgi:hypothetical protein
VRRASADPAAAACLQVEHLASGEPNAERSLMHRFNMAADVVASEQGRKVGGGGEARPRAQQ